MNENIGSIVETNYDILQLQYDLAKVTSELAATKQAVLLSQIAFSIDEKKIYALNLFTGEARSKYIARDSQCYDQETVSAASLNEITTSLSDTAYIAYKHFFICSDGSGELSPAQMSEFHDTKNALKGLKDGFKDCNLPVNFQGSSATYEDCVHLINSCDSVSNKRLLLKQLDQLRKIRLQKLESDFLSN